MSSQSSTVHAPPRLLEHPSQILKPAALALALSQNVLSMRLRGLKALVCKADPLLHTAFTTRRRTECCLASLMARSRRTGG